MLIYITTILSSLLITYIYGRTHKKMGFFRICLCLFIPSLIAGVRDVTVGTDTWFYAEGYFYDVVHSIDFTEFINNIGRFEIGYGLINFVVAQFSSDLNALLFTIQFLTLFFVFKAMQNTETKMIAFSMMIYFFMFYNISLNLIRQTLAMTCFLYALVIWDKNHKNYLAYILLLLSFSFHKSVILAIPIVLFCKYIVLSRSRFKWVCIILVCTFSIIALSYIDYFINILVTVSPLFENFIYYTTDYSSRGSNISEIFLRIIFLSFALLTLSSGKIDKKAGESYMLLIFFEIVFLWAGSISQWVYRLAYYFSIIHVVYLPMMISTYKYKTVYKLAIIIPIIIIWYWLFIDHNVGATIPYKSKILF